jgi:hypothetical protein
MAKQDIDIGAEGNDGTGDSIRESFRKVNENFTELYAVFGLGGTIGFTNLNDTPDTLLGNQGKVVLVKPDATGVDFYSLVSGAGTNDAANLNNTVTFRIQDNQLIVEAVNTRLNEDPAPTAVNPLNIGAAAAYDNNINNLIKDDSSDPTAGINSLVSAWNNTYQGSASITADNLLITKGYADLKYINTSGDTMTGALNVTPADVPNAPGTQAPQIQEVVKRSGDTMTGALTLFDHPKPLSGLGIVRDQQDLQAATKYYVDSSTYSSAINLHVAVNGNDDTSLVPAGLAGRSPARAYRTIAAACARAERIQQSSEPDLGPYIQTITYTDSQFGDTNATVNSVIAYQGVAQEQSDISGLLINERSTIIDDTIDYINTQFPSFVYSEETCRRDLDLILESVRLDILASTVSIKHNSLSRYAGLRYFSNPSAEIAISPQGQLTQTVAALNFAKARTLDLISQLLNITSGQWYNAVDNRFEDVLDTIDVDTPDPALVESDRYYTIAVNSGPTRQTDQSGAANPDLIPGKVIRGKTSGAIGQIVSYTRGIDTVAQPEIDTVEMQLLIPVEFEINEELEYANLVNSKQITIRVESGIYDEQLPIRVPANVSIKGDEFRRVVVRPAAGISQSIWADTWFYRDREIDGLTVTVGGDQYVDSGSNTIGYFGHHYLTDPSDPASTPLRNDQMDVFLMNDNTILRNVTCQRHGGFMMVLDPAGQILTRSPYAQTCSSFSKSRNRKTFHGGMYIDGYSSNMPLTIASKIGDFKLNVTAPSTSGLGIRKPLTPCSFFVNGVRYQINNIVNYVSNNGSNVASATLILDETSNEGNGFNTAIGSGIDIVLQGGGNRSMLANDYTQINDLGYGIIANNNALSELVSVFTYYNHIGYYSRNGSQIRSLTGNNSYGNFGMVAEGSDPDEIASPVTLSQNLVQPVKIYSVTQELVFNGDVRTSVSDGDQIRQTQPAEPNDAVGFVSYVSYNISTNKTTVFIEKNTGGFINSETVVNDTDSTTIGVPESVLSRNFGADRGSVAVYVYDLTDYPLNASEIEIQHATGLYQPYEVITVSDTGLQIPADRESDLCNSTNSAVRRKIWRLDLASVSVGADNGLRETTDFATFGVYRAKQNLLINGIDSSTLARPSTALVFNEQPNFTYRTIGFENTIVGDIPTVGIQTRATIDANFDYVNLTVDNTRADIDDGSTVGPDGSTLKTLGSRVGDNEIAVAVLSDTDALRAIGMQFTWAGVLHEIVGYRTETDINGTYGIIEISDVYSIDSTHVSGINRRVDSPIGDNITLQAGLAAGETGAVTVNISTCRATGHDFLDIGTGGYNDTNFPDRIYGKPINTPVSEGDAIDELGNSVRAQVQERTRGRVFFASTDQDGFFRVGRFFTVDQGTGRVTFNAALVLTNIDGIGFKRGVRVNEFSPDTAFVNARGDAVPTQTAVQGYIDRRLGWNRDGNAIVGGDILGGGAVNRTGDTMSGLLNMGGNLITNLPLPTSNSDVANKLYVDSLDSINKLRDVEITSIADAQTLVYNNNTGKWNNVTFSNDPLLSDIGVTYSGNIANAQINTGVIVNADVNAGAAIDQSKLNLNAAGVRSDASGIGQSDLGVVSFNSAEFAATNGWINLADNGIVNAKLVNSSVTLGSTAVDLGATVTALAGLASVTATDFVGNLTGNVTGNISGNAATATRWQTARTLTIGSAGKNLDGSAGVTWTLSEIGAVPVARTISAGTGLAGGGNLTADRTISIANEGVGTAQLATGERINNANVLAAIGFTPVEQQGTRKIRISWDGSGGEGKIFVQADNDGFTLVSIDRFIAAGTGLTGGGNLTADRTISLNSATVASLALADSAVQPTRGIFAGTGLTGGGNLTANRTISIAEATITDVIIGTSNSTVMTPRRGLDLLRVGTVGYNIWINRAGQRFAAQSYQNNTGRPLQVGVVFRSGSQRYFEVSTNNSTWIRVGSDAGNSGEWGSAYAIVPNGSYYRINGSATIDAWAEL